MLDEYARIQWSVHLLQKCYDFEGASHDGRVDCDPWPLQKHKITEADNMREKDRTFPAGVKHSIAHMRSYTSDRHKMMHVMYLFTRRRPASSSPLWWKKYRNEACLAAPSQHESLVQLLCRCRFESCQHYFFINNIILLCSDIEKCLHVPHWIIK